jgi:Tol biopolymer transport system component
MKRRHLFAILVGWVALLGMNGCAPKPSATPTAITPVPVEPTATPRVASPTSFPAATPFPTVTVAPSATSLPTSASTPEPAPTLGPTPYPTLAAQGPYLAYLKRNGDQPIVVLMDATGAGRKEIELPQDDFIYDVSLRISPNGEWLAYYSGTADRAESAPGLNDLTLHLLQLKDGQTLTVTALLSADYPRNFDVNAAALSKIDPKQFSSGLAPSLWDAFSNGIHSLAWSPDSRHLAFAGEVDGPSSDLYVYDVGTQAIKRLTDGLGEIQQISWSPDGKWILNSSAYWVGEGSPVDTYAAAADGSVVKPVGGGEYFASWLSPSEMLRYSSANGIGNFDLKKVNLETGQVTDWWARPFSGYSFDETRTLLMVMGGGESGNLTGLYLVNLSTQKVKNLTPDFLGWIDNVSDSVNQFVARDSFGTTSTRLIRADGTITQVSDAYSSLDVSPDGRSIALYEPGLAFYASSGELVRSAAVLPLEHPRARWSPDSKGLVLNGNDEPGLIYVPVAEGDSVTITQKLTTSNISWRPDSSGLFFTSGTDLYYWGLGQAQPTLVDQHVPKDYPFQSAWLDSLGPAPSP